MSWFDKVKDHVESGITSGSNLSGPPTLLSQSAKEAVFLAEQQRRLTAMMNSPSPYQTGSTLGRTYTLKEKILMRLDAAQGEPAGFDYIEAARLSDDKMAVFIIINGKHCTLEDDANLFPSDTLITQLRILRK